MRGELGTRELDRRLRRNGGHGVLIDEVRLVIVFEDDREIVEAADVTAQLESVAQVDRDERVFSFYRKQVRILQGRFVFTAVSTNGKSNGHERCQFLVHVPAMVSLAASVTARRATARSPASVDARSAKAAKPRLLTRGILRRPQRTSRNRFRAGSGTVCDGERLRVTDACQARARHGQRARTDFASSSRPAANISMTRSADPRAEFVARHAQQDGRQANLRPRRGFAQAGHCRIRFALLAPRALLRSRATYGSDRPQERAPLRRGRARSTNRATFRAGASAPLATRAGAARRRPPVDPSASCRRAPRCRIRCRRR